MNKPFLYLVQTRDRLPPHYSELQGERSRVLVGCWGAKHDNALHIPGTTWTTGRNRLLESAAAAHAGTYEYLIFVDDDLEFEKGGWREFEDLLLQYRPLIAAPRLINYGAPTREDCSAQSAYCFDACFNAFHASVVEDGVLLPYAARFDSRSWHYSQLILIHLAAVLYPGRMVQFNEVVVRNIAHSAYAQDLSFRDAPRVEEWLKQVVLRPTLRRWVRFKPYLKGAASARPRKMHLRNNGAMSSPLISHSLLRKNWAAALRGASGGPDH